MSEPTRVTNGDALKSTLIGIGLAAFFILFCWFLLQICLGVVDLGDKWDREQEQNLKFQGACENLGGYVADASGSHICIKENKIILTGKEY